MSKTRRAASLLLLFAAFFTDQVVCRGIKIGGGSGGGKKSSKAGDEVGDELGDSLDLSTERTAALSLTIIVAVFTLLQLARAAQRFKKPALPADAPTLPYDVSKTFLWLLTSYLFFYLLFNIFLAVVIGEEITVAFTIGTTFLGQVADVLFLGMVLQIVAYRQRIQLNPAEKPFNLKSFVDGWLLSVILILGIAQDGLRGSNISGNFFNFSDIRNFGIAYEVFNCFASINVIGTAIMAYSRLKKSGIEDNIVRNAAIWITPFVFIRAVYRIINVGLSASAPSMGLFIDREALLIATVVVGGVCSIAVAGVCLMMGAPPKPPKDKKNISYSPVKA